MAPETLRHHSQQYSQFPLHHPHSQEDQEEHWEEAQKEDPEQKWLLLPQLVLGENLSPVADPGYVPRGPAKSVHVSEAAVMHLEPRHYDAQLDSIP